MQGGTSELASDGPPNPWIGGPALLRNLVPPYDTITRSVMSTLAQDRPAEEIEDSGNNKEPPLAGVIPPIALDEVSATGQAVDTQGDHGLRVVESDQVRSIGNRPPDSASSWIMRIRSEAMFRLTKLK